MKVYPDDWVTCVREMRAQGATIPDIAKKIQASYWQIRRLMKRHDIAPARSGPRDLFGEKNNMWRGQDAGYGSLHQRVYTRRGKPEVCVECQQTREYMEWANVSGNYADPNDYQAMCVPCHRKFDRARATQA